MKVRTGLAAVAALVVVACAPAPAPVDTAQIAQEIHAIEAARIGAIRARNLDGAVRPYAPDAMFVAQGRATASTPEQIRATFQAMIEDPNTSIALTAGRAEVAASGDLAFTNATFETTYTDPETQRAIVATGTNVTVWRRQPDGAWMVVADFNIPNEG